MVKNMQCVKKAMLESHNFIFLLTRTHFNGLHDILSKFVGFVSVTALHTHYFQILEIPQPSGAAV